MLPVSWPEPCDEAMCDGPTGSIAGMLVGMLMLVWFVSPPPVLVVPGECVEPVAMSLRWLAVRAGLVPGMTSSW